jgi:hypothetical protein
MLMTNVKFPAYNKHEDKKCLAAIRKWMCFGCGEKIRRFRDWVSREEYFLSGRCQGCQDLVFDREDDEFARA